MKPTRTFPRAALSTLAAVGLALLMAACDEKRDPLAPPEVPVNNPPSASFAFAPSPVNGRVNIRRGGEITVNMCGSRDSDGDKLHFRVYWGDGTDLAGHCLLRHVYPVRGTYTLAAFVSDGQASAHDGFVVFVGS